MSIEDRVVEVIQVNDALERAKAAQRLLPSTVMLKKEVLALRFLSVLELWESGRMTYSQIAEEMDVSKSLIQIMVREARERSHE
jgi:predicted DNA-binding protein (UPF0251 family)